MPKRKGIKSAEGMASVVSAVEVPHVPEAVPTAPEVIEDAGFEEEASASNTKPEQAVSEGSAPVAQPASPAIAAYAHKDRLTLEIEKVLEEDLTDLFLKMNPVERQAFKAKGEETLSKIRQLANAATVNTRKIFSLIREWLKLIPGVNTFFLEQEAKIKTDKILRL